MDYGLQKEVKIDPAKANSELEVVIRDDEILKERTYPIIYLFVYVDGFLVAKESKTLTKNNNINGKYYGYFHRKIKIREGLRIVKIVYRTYRENQFVDLVFAQKVEFFSNKLIKISFNKEFLMTTF